MRYATTMLVAAMVLASCAAGTKSYRCPDGTYVVNPTSAPPDCPTGVFNPRSGDALGDTSTNSLSNLTQTGGTAYSCVYPATATEPNCTQIIAGTDGDSAACVDTSSKSAASTSLEFNSTDNHAGLTASTNYKVSHCVLRNGKKSRAQASASFSTLAGAAPGGGDLTNAGYFVADADVVTCSDSYNGQHPRFTSGNDGPWCTVAGVNSGVVSVGADVYFEKGYLDASTTALIVDWGGTEADPAYIGCFEWNGTNAETCEADDATPDLRGDMTDGAISGLSYDFSGAQLNAGKVQINSDWVTVDKIRVSYWEGRGFRVNGVNQGDGLATGIKFLNVETYATGWSPLTIENATKVVAKNFDFELYNVCEGFERNGASSALLPAGAGNCGASGLPGGVSVARNSDADEGQILIESGVIHRGWGEALNILSSKKVIVRNARYGNVASGGPYCDACDDTVIENIVGWGNNNDCGLSCQGQTGGGQNGNVENSAVLGIGVKYVFRNSLLVGVDRCHNITMGSNAITNGDQVEVYLYNNVCVNPSGTEDAYFNTFLGGNFNSSVITYKLRNYVLWDEALGSDGVDLGSDCDGNYNQWFVAQADTDCNGANDVIGAPSYPTAYATLVAKLSEANSPAFSDVDPTAAMAGDNACYTETIIDWTPDDFIWDEMVAPSDTTHDAWTKANWAAGCKWDAIGNNYDGTDLTRGPVMYTP